MKKLFTLLFAAGLVTAASAQYGDRYRNNNRNYDNSYQSSPYSNYDRGYYNHYSDRDRYRNAQWRQRQRAERMRYERMMMRRDRARYHNQVPYGYYRQPVIQLSIGIGGRR